MTECLRTERRGDRFEIILNRPEKHNAISWDMWQALGQAIGEAERQEGLRAVLLRGEGKSFSSGIDVTTFMLLPQRYGDGWKQKMRTITVEFQAVVNRLERLELPTIALLHGHCLGMALELVLACDLRIATEGARLGLPESLLGLIPDVGGTTRLTRLVGPGRAKELIFTGRPIEARQAEQWGLVNRVVAEAELMSAAESLIAEIARAAPLAVGMAKRVIDGLSDLDRGLTLEGWAQSQLMSTEDFGEAVMSFVQKRPPAFKGR